MNGRSITYLSNRSIKSTVISYHTDLKEFKHIKITSLTFIDFVFY